MTGTSFRSPLFALADRFVEQTYELSPLAATHGGDNRYDDQLDDFSPAGEAAEEQLVRTTLSTLAAIEPVDEIDRVGQAVMQERLANQLGLLESGERRRTFGVLRSPVSSIRQVFEIQPASQPDHAVNIAARLRAVGPALASWQQTLDLDSAAGLVPARRQVMGVAKQLETHAAGAYSAIAQRTASSCGVDVESSGLAAAGAEAERASAALAEWLRNVYAGHAAEEDAVGAERYAPWARSYTGSDLDLAELYEWGWEDLRATNDRMWEIARRLAPGSRTLGDAAAVLDADAGRAVVGTDLLLERLRGLTAGAVEMLDGVHFDIDERIRFCDARLAPEGAMAAPYYIAPSEDLSRPGTTWYPTLGHTRFPMWKLISTWYHESVPGHHLQIGTALLAGERQSRFQRVEAHVSGYSEGWALYAERLMHELGVFEDPGDELGYLSKQAMRAARVVVDIGMHLRRTVPDDVGPLGPFDSAAGRVWDAPLAVELLVERAMVARDRAESEVDRYLGTPGQAISYKVGERAWLACRADARRRLGDSFELKAWHAHALGLGPMGLDPFSGEMARFGRPVS